MLPGRFAVAIWAVRLSLLLAVPQFALKNPCWLYTAASVVISASDKDHELSDADRELKTAVFASEAATMPTLPGQAEKVGAQVRQTTSAALCNSRFDNCLQSAVDRLAKAQRKTWVRAG